MFGLLTGSIAGGFPGSLPALLVFSLEPLARLGTLDILVIALYFAMVLWIGFYLKGAPTPAKSSSWPAAR